MADKNTGAIDLSAATEEDIAELQGLADEVGVDLETFAEASDEERSVLLTSQQMGAGDSIGIKSDFFN